MIERKLLLLFMLVPLLEGQEIPNEFFLFRSKKLLFDYGKFWCNNTTFGPIRFNRLMKSDSDNDTLKIELRIGLYGNAVDQKNGVAIYSYGNFSFQNNFYAYLYPRIVTNPNIFPRYSGVERYFGRTGETDLAGIGFENNWMIMQWGRGGQSWGSGNTCRLYNLPELHQLGH